MHWLISKFLAEEYRKKILTFYSSNNDFLAYALFTWVIGNLKFKHRRKITITEQSGNDLTDYQVLIELDSTNFDFSHSDGNDIRFYNGEVFLPYWIEKWDSVNQEAKIWVKVPSIPANGTVSFYMYYGNPVLLSASSPELTFVRVIDGCVLTLPMDEGSGDTVYDKSGNDNDGTIYGGATWTDGKFGKALSFDGEDDYVEVPDSASLDITDEITIEAWVKPSAFPNDNIGYFILSKGPSSNRAYALYLYRWDAQGGNKATFAISLDGSTFYNANTNYGDIFANTWYHLVGTYDGNKVKLYVNRVLYERDEISGSINSNEENLDIGRWGTSGDYFNGLIDEVRIYNRALSEEEIQDLYNYYGYNTENYPGKTLVRKRVEPEPNVSIGTEETS